MQAEFPVDAGEGRFDRLDADGEGGGDVAVARSGGGEFGAALFGRGEAGAGVVVRGGVFQSAEGVRGGSGPGVCLVGGEEVGGASRGGAGAGAAASASFGVAERQEGPAAFEGEVAEPVGRFGEAPGRGVVVAAGGVQECLGAFEGGEDGGPAEVGCGAAGVAQEALRLVEAAEGDEGLGEFGMPAQDGRVADLLEFLQVSYLLQGLQGFFGAARGQEEVAEGEEVAGEEDLVVLLSGGVDSAACVDEARSVRRAVPSTRAEV